MYERIEKPKENKSGSVANFVAQNKSDGKRIFGFVDNRPEVVTQQKLQAMTQLYSDRSEEARSAGHTTGVIDWAQKFQRSSTNGRIHQLNEQYLVAQDDLIDRSERALAAQESIVSLVKASTFTAGYSVVKLQARESRIGALRVAEEGELAKTYENESGTFIEGHLRKLQKIAINSHDPETAEASRKEISKFQRIQAGGGANTFMTIRDCHRTARLILGDMGVGRLARRKEYSIVNGDGGAREIDTTRVAANKQSTVANKGVIGVLQISLPAFGNLITHNPGLQSKVTKNHPELINDLLLLESKWDYNKAMSRYRIIQSDAELCGLFNATYGINEYAPVKVGQVLTQVNDENEHAKHKEDDSLADLWNFHWAGIIMQDGSDYVTLQAVADANSTSLTTDWWFKMYGADTQSFHSEEKEDSHVGEAPVTIGIKAR